MNPNIHIQIILKFISKRYRCTEFYVEKKIGKETRDTKINVEKLLD